MKKPEDWSQFSLFGGIVLPPINPVHAAWCLCLFVAILLFSTIFLIALYQDAQSNLIALCTEARKLPGFEGFDKCSGFESEEHQRNHSP